MSENYSVIMHRANYHYVRVEEDFIAICSYGQCSPHCKALILTVLEHWTNSKRGKEESDYIYLTMPQWIKSTYMFYERNTIQDCIAELIEEGYIGRRPITVHDQKTFEYKLNVSVVQAAISALPEKKPQEVLPCLDAYLAYKARRKGVRSPEVGEKSQGVREKSPTPPVGEKSPEVGEKSLGVGEKSREGYVKNHHNVDSLTKIPVDSPKILTGADRAMTDVPSSQSKKKAATQEPLLAVPQQAPEMTGAWSNEKVVRYAEWCNQEAYRPTERKRQLKAAGAIHKDDPQLTLEQFKRAYDERNDDWWKENKGKLHVTQMKGKEITSGIDRVHSMLDRLAARKPKPQQQASQPEQVGADGFKLLSKIEIMKLMPDKRREYIAALDAHLAANPGDRRFFAVGA